MKKRLSKKTLISVCTLIAALIIWTMWSNTALMLSTVTVSSNRIPAAFNGFRIAQISDLHNAVFGEDNAELLQILSECEPNIIVITGDLVDAEHTDIDVALDFAKEAVQIADTYYVTGNHEASLSQYDELKAELENTGVVVLEDKAMQLEYNGDDITLIGLSDPSFTLKGDMFGEVPAMVDYEGLDTDSVILLEQIRTIDKQRLKQYMGMMPNNIMARVDKALAISVALEKNENKCVKQV